MIILEILKIIVIVIGCIVGLAILLILLLTLCPFRYGIVISKNGSIFRVNGSVWWLLGLVTVRCMYIEGKFNYYIRLAGFKIITSQEDSDRSGSKKEEIKDKKKKAPDAKSALIENNSEKEENFEKGKEKKISSQKKKLNKNILKKIKAAVRIIKDESFKPALKHIRIELFNFLSHIRPRKISGNILLGLESPDKTALVYAAAANMINIIGADVMMEPDMDEQVFDCNITAQGRLYLGYIVVIAIRSFLDKEFMTFVKKLRSK